MKLLREGRSQNPVGSNILQGSRERENGRRNISHDGADFRQQRSCNTVNNGNDFGDDGGHFGKDSGSYLIDNRVNIGEEFTSFNRNALSLNVLDGTVEK